MLKHISQNRKKVTTFVESKSFDLFIISLICLDAIVFGLFTSEYLSHYFGSILFVLDRLCMAIFIVEMILKLYVYGPKFFHSGWNSFDFTVVAVSSFSFASHFIVLRTFRLFRMFKYINRFSKLKKILSIFGALLPNFIAFLLVFTVLLYVFSIISVTLFGSTFIEFSTLGNAAFTLIQICTLDGWASDIARPVISIYPDTWVFFISFLFLAFLIILSFVMSVIDEIIRRNMTPFKKTENYKKEKTLPVKKTQPKKIRKRPAKK